MSLLLAKERMNEKKSSGKFLFWVITPKSSQNSTSFFSSCINSLTSSLNPS